ncbi:MAG TPA: SpoIIE family protein phosphatase [Rhizomicrobium sp.]|nr:SpoIIE family protein phosphatase [Rhizomicrobium sp.]
MDDGQTRIMTFARSADFTLEDRAHCLELIEGLDAGHRYIVGPAGVSIGRTAPADIVLADSEVSRTHCRLTLENDSLIVTDLGSTNGTFIDGMRIAAPTPLPVGAILRTGRQSLKHEWRTHREILQHDEFDRQIGKARSYVEALLPAPIAQGPCKAEWLFEPCSKLGGDAFGYGALSSTQFMMYMLDVSGHGAGAALHSVAVMNLLRQRALPSHTDMADPAQVLTALNHMFPMEDHAGMYFTLWYGVYDTAARQLHYASAGHHPAFLVPADRGQAIALRTRCGLIGADLETRYTAAVTQIPLGASLYLFSDGVFEFVTTDGVEWGLNDLIPHLLQPPIPEMAESRRLFRDVRKLAQPGGLDDDFTLLVLNFD